MRMLVFTAGVLFIAGHAFAGNVVRQETVYADAASGYHVNVDNINGDIDVEEWDSDGIQAEYTVTCDTQEEMDAINVTCDTAGGLSCEVRYSEDWSENNNGTVDFHIFVPRNTELDYMIDNVNGKIKCMDLCGTAELDLVNGDVEVSGFAGEMRIDVVNGDIATDEVSGLSSVDIVNGSISCTVKELQSDLSIDAVNGQVTLRLETPATVDVGTMSGDIDIADNFAAIITEDIASSSARFGSGGKTISISTVNGDIEILD